MVQPTVHLCTDEILACRRDDDGGGDDDDDDKITVLVNKALSDSDCSVEW
jgi:hypothetical protein